MDVWLAVSHKSKSGVSQPSISKQSLFSVHFHCYPAITGSLKQEKEWLKKRFIRIQKKQKMGFPVAEIDLFQKLFLISFVIFSFY